MIEVKSAVKRALQFLIDLYGDENLRDVRLEEVELSREGDLWVVTFSFTRTTASAIAEAIGEPTPVREYKVVGLRSETGELQFMKIREPV